MAVLVRQHDGNAVAHRRDERVGRAEVDADREPRARAAPALSGSEICSRAIRSCLPTRPAWRRCRRRASSGSGARARSRGAASQAASTSSSDETRSSSSCASARASSSDRFERGRVAARRRRRPPPRAARAGAPGNSSGNAVSVSSSASIAMQRQQILRAVHRILQRAVGFVDPCRRLQREPLLAFRRRRRSDRGALRPAARGRRDRAPPHRSGNARAGRTARSGCARNRSSRKLAHAWRMPCARR